MRVMASAKNAPGGSVVQQEQSFNTIDLVDGSVTVAVHAWQGQGFERSDAQRYQWQDGRWVLRKTAEAAH